jgi:polyisoprenoid-binding protein YceI
MEIPIGTYQVGPQNGRLLVRTRREGVGAMAGHDLTIEATQWEGTVEIQPDRSLRRVDLSVDARSLTVREGTGGARPLTDKDRSEIKANIDSKVLATAAHPQIRFQAAEARDVRFDEGRASATVVGDLEMVGRTHLVTVRVELEPADAGEVRARGTATLRQTDWGIKPYTAFLGALRVANEVVVELEARLAPA